jgi:hypothetical protein
MGSGFSLQRWTLATWCALCSANVLAVETTFGAKDAEGRFIGPNYYQINGSAAPPTEADSVGSFARHAVTRKGFLFEGGERVEVDEQDPASGETDFPGNTTNTPGVTVGMSSVLGPLTPDLGTDPVRARTDFFANHAAAATSRGRFFFGEGDQDGPNSVPDGNDQNDFFLRTSSTGQANSTWTDTWTAAQSLNHSVLFDLDGTIRLTDPCPDATCLISFPGGTTSHELLDWIYDFHAVMAIFDLDDIRECDFISDECDGQDPAPVTVASVTVTSAAGANSADSNQDANVLKNGGTIAVDLNGQLDFEAQAGHDYYIVAAVEIHSANGVALDFFNTFGITGVVDPTGNLQSRWQIENASCCRVPCRCRAHCG